MSTKHTPGPWQFVEREKMEDGSICPGHIRGGVTQLAVCLMESYVVAEAISNDPAWRALAKSEISQANARLIAAAPELLSACIEARIRMLGVAGMERHVAMLDDAIAKAEGTTP